MNRMKLMTVHTLLAAFILPVAIMFLVTGALYTWGFKGSYSENVYEVKLRKPIRSEVSELTKVTQLELEKLAIHFPEGQPTLKVYGRHFLLEWTGSSKDVILEPTDNELMAKLTIKYTSWYRNLVQLHKAKGGVVFKIYAVIFAISIVVLLISGFIMAWRTPQLKRLTLISLIIGLCSFTIAVFLS
jgi:hypothetical protein